MAALDDDPGDPGQFVDIVQQFVLFEEKVLEEELGANAREGHCLGRIAKTVEQFFIGQKRRDMAFPQRPFAGRFQPRRLVVAGQAFVIGAHEIAALGFGNDAGELVPLLGHDLAGAVTIEPGFLLLACKENAAQHQFADPLGIFLGVSERERRTPATAESLPFLVSAHIA